MAKSFDTQEIEDILAQLENMHPQAVCELDYKSPFELLVAVILSAQCTDKRVNQVTEKLFKSTTLPSSLPSLKKSSLLRISIRAVFIAIRQRILSRQAAT